MRIPDAVLDAAEDDATLAAAAEYLGSCPPNGADVLAIEDDFAFSEAWRALSADERSAIGAAGFARFSKANPHLGQSTERLRRDQERATLPRSSPPLDWPALALRNPPLRQWALYGWLGYFINLLVGSAGIGKTLLAQQTGSALVLGRSYIDEIARPLNVLMWACEDDHDELWRRQAAIASSFGVGLDAFAQRLIILPRLGAENVLVTTEFGRPMFTPRIGELTEQANDYRADVVILDNAAQLYGASENDRHAVTMFMNGLAGALPGRAVLLLAHPARSAGSEFSGSGAWEAVARNRLYLGSRLPDQEPDDDYLPDDNVRYLARRKANYSARDWRRFTYRDGVLVPDEVETGGGMVDHLRRKQADRVVLQGLGKLAEMKVRAVDGANSPAFLPRLLLDYRLAEDCQKKELANAMRDHMVAGRIARGVVGKYSNRNPMEGLIVCTK